MTAKSYANAVVPDEAQIKGFFAEGPEPIYMLNLLKFKDKAAYADGRETDLTGRQAYAIYGNETVGHLDKVGGKILYAADVTRLTIGEMEEPWDHVAYVMYPSRAAMMEMMRNPDYQASAVHREAGLIGQLLIETKMTAGPAAD